MGAGLSGTGTLVCAPTPSRARTAHDGDPGAGFAALIFGAQPGVAVPLHFFSKLLTARCVTQFRARLHYSQDRIAGHQANDIVSGNHGQLIDVG